MDLRCVCERNWRARGDGSLIEKAMELSRYHTLAWRSSAFDNTNVTSAAARQRRAAYDHG